MIMSLDLQALSTHKGDSDCLICLCKESACNAGDRVWIPGSGRLPGEEYGYPLQLFLPGEFHGQRSLAGYSP